MKEATEKELQWYALTHADGTDQWDDTQKILDLKTPAEIEEANPSIKTAF